MNLVFVKAVFLSAHLRIYCGRWVVGSAGIGVKRIHVGRRMARGPRKRGNILVGSTE